MTMSPDDATPTEDQEDSRPDAPRTWTAPELVRLRAGATGNSNTSGVGDDGPAYQALS